MTKSFPQQLQVASCRPALVVSKAYAAEGTGQSVRLSNVSVRNRPKSAGPTYRWIVKPSRQARNADYEPAW